MPEVKLPDATITLDGILYIFAVAVAVCVAISSIYKGWEALKKISVRDRVKALEGRLDKVEARLQLGDKRFELQSDDMGAMLATQQALLVHFITGNDHAKLKDELQNLNNYMNKRATRVIEYANQQEQQNGGNNT